MSVRYAHVLHDMRLSSQIRSFDLTDIEIDEDDPFGGILAATMFATRATVHTTLQATPAQLVFGRDAILNTTFEANWKYIKDRKQKLIDQNNARENAKRIPHEYNVGDSILYRVPVDAKFSQHEWTGPYRLRNVYNNGSVKIRRGAVSEIVNIRNIKPFFE